MIAPPGPATVLVVDDNEANRSLARSTLEDEDYRVVVATGGEEGVAAFEREAPDCVLLDVRMPEVDGFAACERMRALPGGRDTPILFLTALRDVDTFDQAMSAGAADFLTKPVRPAELLVRVKTALELRRTGAELRAHYELLRDQRAAFLRVQLQKERLTAFLVHDLKNPVNAMDLHAQLLLRDKTLSESARASAGHIRREARRLTRLIVNLLDVSKGDEGKLAPSKAQVDVAALVADVCDELEISARERDVTLVPKIETATVWADAELAGRMLANLVENAVRHAPRGSRVTVEVAPYDGGVEVRVADSGAGVPEELRESIFDPFVQSGAAGSVPERGGRGLGLTFCRLVTEAHGGRIWVDEGAPGAVFHARFPEDTDRD